MPSSFLRPGPWLLATLLCIALPLTGCGGGGGSAATVSNNSNTPEANAGNDTNGSNGDGSGSAEDPAPRNLSWGEPYQRDEQYPNTVDLPQQLITMRDGIRLAATVTLPADENGNAIDGQFPVIATFTGYNQALGAIGAADPAGAALYNYYTKGELKGEGSSITEGIGVNRITGNLEGLDVDHIFRIEDAEMLPILFELVKTEGLSLGGSAGINIAGAIRLARELGPGKTIVTMLCDAGSRYAGKLFNPEFLSSRGLPVPPWADSEAPRATA